MKEFDTYLFDLDGTLVDSKEGIINSIKFSLMQNNLKIPSDKELNSFIGPPLRNSYSNFFGLSEEQSKKVVEIYRERYRNVGIKELKLYDSSLKVLKELRRTNKIIALATSKAQEFAQTILNNLGITEYFDHIQGADAEGKFGEKSDVVRLCLEALKPEKEKTLMIGDRLYDIVGAKANGIKCVGVRHGYAEQQELEEYGADYIIDDLYGLL